MIAQTTLFLAAPAAITEVWKVLHFAQLRVNLR